MRISRIFFAVLILACVISAGFARADEPATKPAAPGSIYLPAPKIQPTAQTAPLLIRELTRQSLLIAAREELNLWTHDGVLGETAPGGVPDAIPLPNISFDLAADSNGHVLFTTFDYPGPGGQPLSVADRHPLQPGIAGGSLVMPFVIQAEEFSRNKYLKLLQQAGFRGEPAPTGAPLPVPDALVDRLDEMSFFSQWEVVRQAHAAIHLGGPSPELLGLLVRGYANLGQLTRFQLTAAHQVFEARSLLYAQRMVVADPNSPLAHWYRAYACALVGLHVHAMEDLNEAHRLADGKINPPSWVQLIEPLCAYDTIKLKAIANDNQSLGGLAMLMAFITVEREQSLSPILSTEVGREALGFNPHCFRIIDGMCDSAWFAATPDMTEIAPTEMVNALRHELPRFIDLPENVRKAWRIAHTNPDLYSDIASVARSMTDAQDQAEPSWAVLGQLIQETNFIHVQRRAIYLEQSGGNDVDDFIKTAWPLVQNHRYHSLIASYGSDYYRGDKPVDDLMADLAIVDPQWQILLMQIPGPVKNIKHGEVQIGPDLWDRSNHDADSTAYEFARFMDIPLLDDLTDTQKYAADYVQRASRLSQISPQAPLVSANTITFDWNSWPGQLAYWKTQAVHQPTVAGALGRHYHDTGEFALAETYLSTYINSAHDIVAYEMLADSCLQGGIQEGNEDQWVLDLEQCLNQDGAHLDRSRIQMRIAQYFMDIGNFQRALTYVDKVAKSGGDWAMMPAARCHEGMKDWYGANQLMRDYAEKFDYPMEWYLFCKRTGHGDQADATQMTAKYLHADQHEAFFLERQAIFQLVENDRDKAIKTLHQVLDMNGEPWDGMLLAALSDDVKDAAARDGAWSTVITKGPGILDDAGKPRRQMIALARLFADTVATGPDSKLDLRAADKIIVAASPAEQTVLNYLVARFLDAHGDSNTATDYRTRCVTRGSPLKFAYTLACIELRAKGIEPMDLNREFPRRSK